MPVEETKQEARKRRCRESARRSWLKKKLLGIPETLEHREIRLAGDRVRKNIATRTPKYQEYIKRYYAKNRKKLILYSKRWYEKNTQAVLERAQVRYQTNRKAILAARRARGRPNPAHINAVKRAWWKRTKPQRDALAVQRRAAITPEKRANDVRRARLYRKRHPGVMSAATALRRARKAAVTIRAEQIKDWIGRVKSQTAVRCYYCDGIVLSEHVHIDHVQALARGGEHSVTNLVACCPGCNMQKHAKSVAEWKRVGQQILPL